MWTWLIGVYAVLLLMLTGAAGWVALFVTDHRRSTRAHALLKILLAAIGGSGGLIAVALRLHQTGLL
jgi:hypothetical protein